MKKFTKIMSAAVLAAASLSLSGCQDEDFGFSKQDVREGLYAKNFEKTFGNIDPNQNWDLFGQLADGESTRSLTRAAADIVVTDLGESYYKNVTEEMNSQYQKMLPESEDRPRPYASTNLGRVTQNFTAYTTTLTLYPIHWNTSGSDVIGVYYYTNASDPEKTTITGNDGKTYYVVKKQVYENKTHVDGVKETSAYAYVTTFTEDHWNELKTAYPTKYLIADGTQIQQYGGFISEGTKIVKAGFTKEKDGQELDVYYRWNDGADPTTSVVNPDLVTLHSTYVIGDGSATYKDAYGNNIYDGSLAEYTTTYNYGQVASYQDLSDAFDDYNYLRSKPIQVTIPANVGKIGFYITNSTNPTKYSESNLNDKYDFSDVGKKEECFVATYIDTDADGNQIKEDGKPVRYLCFEDWTGTSNFDMNDVVFRVFGLDEGGSKIVDEDEYDETAILVCEDLGGFDFDYNDVVLKLNYRESQTKEYTRDAQGNVTNVELGEIEKSFSITAMAAGGANRSDVYYGTTKWGEIHELIDGEAPQIINAGPEMGSEGHTVTLTGSDVPEYTHATQKFLSQVFSNGYIQIKTFSNGANDSDDAANIITSVGYKTTGAPMMILLPADYLWCRETEGIEGVYPGFTEWVSDATLTNWLSSRSRGNQKFTNRVVPVISDNVPATIPDDDDDDDDDDEGNDDSGNTDPLVAAGYMKLTQQKNIEGWKRGFDLSSLKSTITSGSVEIKFVADSWNGGCTVHLGSSSDVTSLVNWSFTPEDSKTYSATKSVSELTTDYIYCCSANSEPVMYFKAVSE